MPKKIVRRSPRYAKALAPPFFFLFCRTLFSVYFSVLYGSGQERKRSLGGKPLNKAAYTASAVHPARSGRKALYGARKRDEAALAASLCAAWRDRSVLSRTVCRPLDREHSTAAATAWGKDAPGTVHCICECEGERGLRGGQVASSLPFVASLLSKCRRASFKSSIPHSK